jgi:GNAT superfamily N-acetyltransferase
MLRGGVSVRDAIPHDADALVSIWSDFVAGDHKASRDTPDAQDVATSIARLETDASERLIVAVIEDEVVGVAHLRRAPVSPLHLQDAVQLGFMHVLNGYRRRGVGRSLLEAAADWADEKDSQHIVAAVAASSRDANRFLARLGLAQVALVRATTVAGLRSKLDPASAKSTAHAVTNVVAARRMMRRRSRTVTSD